MRRTCLGSLFSGWQCSPLASFASNDGVIIAGGTGRTAFTRLFTLDQVRSPECTDALIETLNDRAFELDLKVGCLCLSTLPDYVGNFTRHTLVKSSA